MDQDRPSERKIKPTQPPVTFDEQLWPVNIALLVLGGFVAGMIIAQSSFEDEWRIFYNGWVRLASLAVSLGLLMWLASRLRSHRFQRALQLAALVSIIIHIGVIAWLYRQSDSLDSKRFDPNTPTAKDALPPPEEPELVVQQEYRLEGPGEQPRDEGFEKPVAATARNEKPVPAEREQPPAPVEIPRETQRSVTLPAPAPNVAPRGLKMTQAQEAAPRKAGQPSILSKRAAEAQINPENPVAATPQTPITDQPPAKVLPQQAAAVQKQQNLAPTAAPKPSPQTEATAPRQQETVQLARRELRDAPSPEMSSIPMARQALNHPVQPHRAPDASPTPDASPAMTPAPAVAPQVSTTARQRAGGSLVSEQPGRSLKMSTAPRVAPLDAPRHELAEEPRLASAAGASPARMAKAPSPLPGANGELAQAGPVDRPAGSSAGPAAKDLLAPSTTLARNGASGLPQAPMASERPLETSAAPRVVTSPQMQRAETAAAPSLTPSAPPGDRLARAVRPAKVEASPIALDSPAVGDPAGATSAQPDAQPSRLALAKGTGGIVGVGRGPSVSGGGVPETSDLTVGPGIAASPARAGQSGSAGPLASVAGGSGGSPNVSPRTQNGTSARSSHGVAPIAALATQAVADVPQAPRGEGGGTLGGSPQGKGDGPAAVRSGSSNNLPLAALAVEGRGNGAGGGVGGSGLGGPSTGKGNGNGAGGNDAGGVTAAPMTLARAGTGESAEGGPDVSGSGTGGGGVGTGGTGKGGYAPRLTHSLGNALSAETQADIPESPGSGGSGPGGAAGEGGSAIAGRGVGQGDPNGALGPATAVGPKRSAGGFIGQPTGGPIGVAAGPLNVDTSLVGTPGNGMNPRGTDAFGDKDAPQVSSVPTGGIVRKANVAGVLDGSAATVADVPADGSSGIGGTGLTVQPGELALKAQAGAPGRRAGNLPVEVAAAEGPGGLGTDFTPEVGSPQRRALRDSEVVSNGAGRFLGRKAGGTVVVDGRAREPSKAFVGRGGQRNGRGGGPNKPPERTEGAVELGLDFLARHQLSDGRWSLTMAADRAENEKPSFYADSAATGLALLSFLGAGYDHYDEQYKNVVQAGLQFLVEHQQPSGNLYLPQDPVSNKSAQLYSHGIATIALCEAYGMTGDDALRLPAQKAINFILASQHPTLGGWRYEPQQSSDTSVSGWQLMALKSGELAGLKVPEEAYRLARHWLDQAQSGPDGSQYAYNPYASEMQKQGRRPTTTMTAVGQLMRLYLGWNRDDPHMQEGAQHLLQNLPKLGSRTRPARDTYYWYYATQVMFHMKGEYWRQWNERLHPLLIDQQIQVGPLAGSWDPLGPVPDRWGPQAGRIYVTTMNLLSLEVYYRHLPIYESEAR